MNHYQGILLWTEVVCGQCSTTTCGEYVRHGRRQMRMVTAELKKEGWVIRNGDAYCPACQGNKKHAGAGIELGAR